MLRQLLSVTGALTDDVKRLPAKRAVHVDSSLALQGHQDVYELAAGQADVGKLRLHVAGVEGAGHRLPAIQSLRDQIVRADDCIDECTLDTRFSKPAPDRIKHVAGMDLTLSMQTMPL